MVDGWPLNSRAKYLLTQAFYLANFADAPTDAPSYGWLPSDVHGQKITRTAAAL